MKRKTVEIDETVKPTFDDGTTEKKVPGEGTYTVAPDGTVTFTPEKNFTVKEQVSQFNAKIRTAHQ